MPEQPRDPADHPKSGASSNQAPASAQDKTPGPFDPGVTRPIPAVDDASAEENGDFVKTLSQDIVTSFIGKEGLPKGRKTSGRFWLQTGRALYRLLMPRANQIGFAIGFWVLRAVGLIVLSSWLYFGLYEAFWDDTKLTAGLVVLLLGPLILRGIEFLLENIVLKGATRESWRHFWDFRRMMTPRSIQTGFFAGFWLLVFCGLLIVLSGFRDLVLQRKAGSVIKAITSAAESVNEAANLATSITKDSTNPAIKYFMNKMTPGLLKELQSADPSKPPPESILRDLHKEAKELKETDPVLLQLSKGDGAKPSPSVWDALALPKDLQKVLKTKTNPFERIVTGFSLMFLGPMALRLIAECIILFFRMNETLTDISKQLEIANRRAEQEKRDR
jgi:hypothetical protein